MVGVGVNDVPIVGEPVAYGVGFFAFLLVAFSRLVARYFLTFAHEGGHMLATFITFRQFNGYDIKDDSGGSTKLVPVKWRLSTPIIFFAGYVAPSLFGLAAAALIAQGNPVAVLMITALSGILGVVLAANALAGLVAALVLFGCGWVLLYAPPSGQAAAAVGVAWFLLISGFVDNLLVRLTTTVDARALARMTLVPRVVWAASWIAISLVALIVGAQLLLRPGYSL